MNRQNLSFKLKTNHLAEHSPDELQSFRGRHTTPRAERDGFGRKNFVMSGSPKDIPDQINWRLYGEKCLMISRLKKVRYFTVIFTE